jgi:hypothetical protein
MIALVVVGIVLLYVLLRGVSYYTDEKSVDKKEVPMTCMCSQTMPPKMETVIKTKPEVPSPIPDTSMAPSAPQMMSGSTLGN